MVKPTLSEAQISEAIALAWADDVSFETINEKLGLTEPDIILLMRGALKPSSFRLWRKRVSPLSIERASQPKMPKPKAEKSNKAQSNDGSLLTLEKLAQAWVKTKNFPKNH